MNKIRFSLVAALAAVIIAGGAAGTAHPAQAAGGLVDVPVLRQTMRPGDLISKQDIIWTRIPANQAVSTIITDPKDVIGMAAAWSLAPGRPLRISDVHRPILAKQGDLVKMIVTMPYMTLTSVGRVLQNGSLGDTVSVVNTTSHKTVQGTVVADGSVQILPGGQISPASN